MSTGRPLPPPTTRPVTRAGLPPVLPKAEHLVPQAPRRPFYAGYTWRHWSVLVIGFVILVILFGPFYLRAIF